jgi:hypothetical protein
MLSQESQDPTLHHIGNRMAIEDKHVQIGIQRPTNSLNQMGDSSKAAL